MDAGIIGQCGRTQIAGNVDYVNGTETQLAANAVTKVTKGGSLVMTIHQVNADGAGPYTCDLDQDEAPPSMQGTFKGNLTVTNNIPGANGLSQAKEQAFNITIAMPADMACKGGSTGNVCIVRCRNNSVAGPFGGCVAVIQSDVTPETAASNNQANTKAAKAKTEKLKAQAKA